ncbi:MAG: HEAT repeat domain-containing protein, partial [Gemmataceae bacterium]|nr:HEAT repeat domain-containing protein [Gemmataceae bacterium]
LLGGEEAAARGLMIGQLSRIEGRWATMALAQRAVVEPSPKLREQAVKELAGRDPRDYVPLLLSAMSYPWPAVARHAAEALGALRRTEALPGLLRLLDGPSPERPYAKPGRGMFVREMVKVNHGRNCMLCHAVSESPGDPVRGLVPPTDRTAPPSYYAARTGRFVRADITYIRQDFSLPMTVKEPGLWSPRQRFDFITRERKATRAETVPQPALATPHQRAAMFAITSLTGKDHGPKVEDWRKTYLGKEPAPRSLSSGIADGVSLAIGREGRPFTLGSDRVPGLARLSADGTWGIASGRAVRLADGKPSPVGEKFDAPRRIVPDGKGGAWLTEAAMGDTKGALWHLDAEGKRSKLPQPFADPCALALSPDGTRLYIAGARGHDLWAFAVLAPGKLGEGQRITRHGTAGPARIVDLAVDRDGNVCLFDAESSVVSLINPAGARLASSRLASPPVAGAASGRTAYALAGGELVAVSLDIEPLVGLASR